MEEWQFIRAGAIGWIGFVGVRAKPGGLPEAAQRDANGPCCEIFKVSPDPDKEQGW